jgi:hypothetical protein
LLNAELLPRMRRQLESADGRDIMGTTAVADAVDALFVKCISSVDSLRAFRKAALLVQRLAQTPEREHFAHLAAALDAQQRVLQTLRKNQRYQVSQHARARDRELRAFYEAHEAVGATRRTSRARNKGAV